MSYSIKIQESTGLWIVVDDNIGKTISRGALPSIAVNLAIEKGMPSAERDALLASAQAQEQQDTPILLIEPAGLTAAHKRP